MRRGVADPWLVGVTLLLLPACGAPAQVDASPEAAYIAPVTPSNLVPWAPPAAEVESATEAARPELTDASRELVDTHFHGGARHYIQSRDQQALGELAQGLQIDPEHEPSLKLLQKLLERQQQQQQQQQQDEQQQQQEQQQGEATPTPSEEEQQEAGAGEATPTPTDEQQEQQPQEYEAREMSEEEAEDLLEQLEREEAQRRREEMERHRLPQYRVEKDW